MPVDRGVPLWRQALLVIARIPPLVHIVVFFCGYAYFMVYENWPAAGIAAVAAVLTAVSFRREDRAKASDRADGGSTGTRPARATEPPVSAATSVSDDDAATSHDAAVPDPEGCDPDAETTAAQIHDPRSDPEDPKTNPDDPAPETEGVGSGTTPPPRRGRRLAREYRLADEIRPRFPRRRDVRLPTMARPTWRSVRESLRDFTVELVTEAIGVAVLFVVAGAVHLVVVAAQRLFGWMWPWS